MYVSMYPASDGSGHTVFRFNALKLGDYYIGSPNNGHYDFSVGKDWNAHPACVSILETLSEDNDKPIAITFEEESISIDPIIAGELFDCLFAYTIIKDHQ